MPEVVAHLRDGHYRFDNARSHNERERQAIAAAIESDPDFTLRERIQEFHDALARSEVLEPVSFALDAILKGGRLPPKARHAMAPPKEALQQPYRYVCPALGCEVEYFDSNQPEANGSSCPKCGARGTFVGEVSP